MKKRTSSKKQRRRNYRRLIVEWFQTLAFAFVFVLVLHTFIIQPFVVPTPSMAGTVLVGDHILVSKLHYGPKTPRTLGIPFTDLYIDDLEIPSLHLPGFSEIKRGDVVVFHYPPELEKPVDKRQPYLKRVYGLPGDRLELRDKVIYVNEQAQTYTPTMQQMWRVYKTDPRVNLPAARLQELGVESIQHFPNSTEVRFMASRQAIAEIQSWSYVERVEPFVTSYNIEYDRQLYPSMKGQTPDNYGPLWIPAGEATIELNDENWPLYGLVINRYEGRRAERLEDGSFVIDGAPAGEYTFKQNYYFMIGDNRDNSLDSRFWGLVPQDHLMGKAVATFFSWDQERSRPRLDRIMKLIK